MGLAWPRLWVAVAALSLAAGSRETSVVFATHCSVDRLWNLEQTCVRWGGKISVAIYAPDMSRVETREAAARVCRRCSLASITTVNQAMDDYPINALRNKALRGAKLLNGTHVFVIDADFWPSKSTRHLIKTALEDLATSGAGPLTALVVPAFEMKALETDLKVKAFREHRNHGWLAAQLMPQTVPELMSCLLNCRRKFPVLPPLSRPAPGTSSFSSSSGAGFDADPGGQAVEGHRLEEEEEEEAPPRRALLVTKDRANVYCSPFHHHGSTRFAQWLVALRPTRLSCFTGNFYEPFVVVPLEHAGFFDVRYDGYGKNKLAYIVSLRGRGFEFWSTPRAFVVHTEHAASAAHRAWSHAQSTHKAMMDRLFEASLTHYGLFHEGVTPADSDLNEAGLETKHCALPTSLAKQTAAHLWTKLGVVDVDERKARIRGAQDLGLVYYENAELICDVISRVSHGCLDMPPGKAAEGPCATLVGAEAARWKHIDDATDAFWATQQNSHNDNKELRGRDADDDAAADAAAAAADDAAAAAADSSSSSSSSFKEP